MKRNIAVYLEDVLNSINHIEKYTKNLSSKNFEENIQVQDAVVRRLEIIGEAVKNIPASFRKKHSDIPWKVIAGTRDVLIHEYFGVNVERVWLVVKGDLPKLKKQITDLLRNFSSDT